MPNKNVLEEEQNFYNAIKYDLINDGHEGEYCLIKGLELAGTFPSFETAYAEERFGNVPMLIKQILPQDPIISIFEMSFPTVSMN